MGFPFPLGIPFPCLSLLHALHTLYCFAARFTLCVDYLDENLVRRNVLAGLGGVASGNGHLGSPSSPSCPYAATPSSYLYGAGARVAGDSTAAAQCPTGNSSIASLRLKAKQHCPSSPPPPPHHVFPYPASPNSMSSARQQSVTSSSSSAALAACQYALV